jgi:hypothetical protein
VQFNLQVSASEGDFRQIESLQDMSQAISRFGIQRMLLLSLEHFSATGIQHPWRLQMY